MLRCVLLIAVLIAGAACADRCKKCLTDNTKSFKCGMLENMENCMFNKACTCSLSYDAKLDLDEACDDQWASVFFVIAGSGVKVYNSFMGKGARSTWGLSKNCLHRHCSDFYRSDLIDVWESLPIDKVKLVIHQNGKTALTMTFDGRQSTNTNWFTLKRMISSPWNDLNKKNSYYFSIKGFHGVRLFYVAKKHRRCKTEYGWLAVIQKGRWCNWEKAKSYPRIVFSKQKSATVWGKDYGVGDSMEIFIKMIL